MVAGEVKEFLQAAGANPALGKELESAVDEAVMQAVFDVARRHGYTLTLDELRAYASGDGVELSEEELGAVAGGVGQQQMYNARLQVKMAVFAGGGGY
jgi:predicted ribosomally synthesized peptide with nif11-like leader